MMKIKSSRPISITEAHAILTERKDEGSELGYEQAQAIEYTDKFTTATKDKVEKVAEKISKNEKLGPEMAMKIVDVRPASISTLRAIISKDRIDLSEEEAKEVLEIVSKI